MGDGRAALLLGSAGVDLPGVEEGLAQQLLEAQVALGVFRLHPLEHLGGGEGDGLEDGRAGACWHSV